MVKPSEYLSENLKKVETLHDLLPELDKKFIDKAEYDRLSNSNSNKARSLHDLKKQFNELKAGKKYVISKTEVLKIIDDRIKKIKNYLPNYDKNNRLKSEFKYIILELEELKKKVLK